MGPVAMSVALGLLAGCNSASDAGQIVGQTLSETGTNEVFHSEAELIRLANALSWKRGISGDEAMAIVRKAGNNSELAPYRKMEREHARYLRQQRLNAIRARDSGSSDSGGGGGGGGGGHAH